MPGRMRGKPIRISDGGKEVVFEYMDGEKRDRCAGRKIIVMVEIFF